MVDSLQELSFCKHSSLRHHHVAVWPQYPRRNPEQFVKHQYQGPVLLLEQGNRLGQMGGELQHFTYLEDIIDLAPLLVLRGRRREAKIRSNL